MIMEFVNWAQETFVMSESLEGFLLFQTLKFILMQQEAISKQGNATIRPVFFKLFSGLCF